MHTLLQSIKDKLMSEEMQPRGIPIQLLGIFRLIMAVILSSVYILSARLSPEALPISHYFQVILLIYLVFLLSSTLLLKRQKFQTTTIIYFFGLLDLGFISALCFFTDGLNSPLVILLLISFMVHGAFLSMPRALSLLGISVCIQLGLWLKFEILPEATPYSLYQLMISQGILRLVGQNCFAFLALILTNSWLHKYEASQREVDAKNEELKNASVLHEAIIQQSRSGLIVLDSSGRIILMNNYIKSWFGDLDLHNSYLMDYLPTLTERFYLWNYLKFVDPSLFEYNDEKYYIEFAEISQPSGNYALIQIEPTDIINMRAQQDKLVALGRLTAAIAHEIRNPMASIYQASQLLAEQENITEVQNKLITMINNNVQRANRIISDVLVLAKKNERERKYFKLPPFIHEIVDEFLIEYPQLENNIEITIAPNISRVLFDIAILRQMITNLLNNAIIHSGLSEVDLKIMIEADMKGDTPVLAIYDNGKGLTESVKKHLFEPFFTTHKHGTGLGLYITKELCLSSGGLIQYVEINSEKHGFMIIFPKNV